MDFTARTRHLRPEGAYQVLSQARQLEAGGKDIIHLEIGQPYEDTFPDISKAGIEAIQDGHTRYTPPAGLPDLRQEIAEHAGKRRGITIEREEVVVSPGAKPNLFFPTLALVEPGDEVLYPDPGFPTYAAMIGVAGGKAIPIPLREEQHFSFDMDTFRRHINDRTRLIILNSPGNPTGAILPRRDLEKIADAARTHDCWVLSDEIYSRLCYEEDAPSIASLPGMKQRTIIVDGFSKTYAMTGWRLGYGIMPEPLARRVELLLTHATGSSAHFTQLAGIQALTGSQSPVDKMRNQYRQRRDTLLAGLNRLPGMSCLTPSGAFYVFPNISALGLSSQELADFLLHEAGVAVLPGTAFGKHGEGYLRLCYANSLARIKEALARMETALQRLT